MNVTLKGITSMKKVLKYCVFSSCVPDTVSGQEEEVIDLY